MGRPLRMAFMFHTMIPSRELSYRWACIGYVCGPGTAAIERIIVCHGCFLINCGLGQPRGVGDRVGPFTVIPTME